MPRSIRFAALTGANRLLGAAGLRLARHRRYDDLTPRFVLKAQQLGLTTILDVGANAGYSGIDFRAAGWRGCIESFEPTSSAHAKLLEAAHGDPAWRVAPRSAVGAELGEATINIADNSWSSSLLAVLPSSTIAAPDSATVASETVTVAPLDALVTLPGPYALKMDTQGFELEVLKGAPRILGETRLVNVELSLAPLYAGAPSYLDVCGFLDAAGFRCVGFFDAFPDHARQVSLAVDGLFVRS